MEIDRLDVAMARKAAVASKQSADALIASEHGSWSNSSRFAPDTALIARGIARLQIARRR